MSLNEDARMWFKAFLELDDCLGSERFIDKIKEINDTYELRTPDDWEDYCPQELGWKTCLLAIPYFVQDHPREDEIVNICESLLFYNLDNYREFFQLVLEEDIKFRLVKCL